MSVPSHYLQRHVSADPKEDCRDYLRTGRCKYGASCKYNHPANVQSGGGMKGPIDPSEPMFPVRPNEPICQYYIKHGTCKFGQACKFHHPPPNSLPVARMNAGPYVVNGGAKEVSWSPTNEREGSVLPQRPDEPNCIYFLKNGRCKYGSTCRYHHPLNYHERKPGVMEDGRIHLQASQGHGDSGVQPKLHYVSLPPGTYQQGHFVVADGQLAFLSLDGSSNGQVISIGPQNGNQDGSMVFATNKQPSLSRDVGSSTSSTSIASSYESSNIGSGGSLNTFNMVEQNSQGRPQLVQHGRAVVIQNSQAGEASLPRIVSTSNGSDGSAVYFDSGTFRGTMSTQSGPPGNTSWRGQRSASFDHSRQRMSHVQHPDGIHESASVPSFPSSHDDQGNGQSFSKRDYQRSPASLKGRHPPGSRTRRSRQSGGEVDDGLSMMTSALLTMLDTPEEVAGEHFEEYDDQYFIESQSSTPLTRNQYASRAAEGPATHMQSGYNLRAAHYMPQPGVHYDNQADQSIGMPVHPYDDQYDRDDDYSYGQTSDRIQRWSPSSWQGGDQHINSGQMLHSSRSIQSQRSHNNSSPDASNVGLYLS